MTILTKTQLSVLASYSSPFILFAAIGINILLAGLGISGSQFRVLLLGASFPIGLGIGRVIYLRRSNVTITYDEDSFEVVKGKRMIVQGRWKNYQQVSINLDQYGRPDLRLYKALDGDFVELPISRTNADPQNFRDRVQGMIGLKQKTPSLQAVEAS